VLVVANPVSRNSVTSAMFLVLTIVSMAGLFVLLHAFFLAAVQILVYAGAVMVLFVFVIMLLDLKEEELRHVKMAGAVLAVVSVGVIAGVMIVTIRKSTIGLNIIAPSVEGSTRQLGERLFAHFALPFESPFPPASGGDDRHRPAQQKGPEMTPIGLQHYLIVSVLLFCIGLVGVLIRRNVLVIYMSLELMLNAANLALVGFSDSTITSMARCWLSLSLRWPPLKWRLAWR